MAKLAKGMRVVKNSTGGYSTFFGEDEFPWMTKPCCLKVEPLVYESGVTSETLKWVNLTVLVEGDTLIPADYYEPRGSQVSTGVDE